MATGRVLLVDDEEIVLGVGKRMLEKMGFSVLTAKSGQEALNIYKKNPDDIDLVVLDMIMPDMGAGETYVGLSSLNPKIKVLISSGYSADQRTRELLDRGCNGFIQKPFRMQELSDKIGEIISKI
jgi:CheY-like chemotaxis protein